MLWLRCSCSAVPKSVVGFPQTHTSAGLDREQTALPEDLLGGG